MSAQPSANGTDRVWVNADAILCAYPTDVQAMFGKTLRTGDTRNLRRVLDAT